MDISACALSGHRPSRFHFGYDESHEDCMKIKATLREQIEFLVEKNVTIYYSGMAMGIDLWAASIVLDLKSSNANIHLNAAIPCRTQADRWPLEQQEFYYDILDKCGHVTTLYEKYTRSCMFERNRYMVDRSDYLLAVYDGNAKGGTAYTTDYARKKGREIIIIHPDTLVVTNSFGLMSK